VFGTYFLPFLLRLNGTGSSGAPPPSY